MPEVFLTINHILAGSISNSVGLTITGASIVVSAILVFLLYKANKRTSALKSELNKIKEEIELKDFVLDNTNKTILFVDNDLNIIWINRSNKLRGAKDSTSAIGMKCYKALFNYDSVCPFCILSDSSEYVEHYLKDDVRYLGMEIKPVHSINGKLKGYLKSVEDITEKKLTEKALIDAKKKAEESDRLKSAFLANMSHEIRTPMNAIIGFSELLNDPEITDDERRDYINIVQSNGHQLLKLISDLLVFSQIESGQLKIQMKEIVLTEILKEVHQQFIEEKRRLNKDRIDIALDLKSIPDDLMIKTDPVRIKQILFNLMTNALKFTSEGNITIGVEQENRWIRIYVSDTGCGIYPEKLKKIFKRFAQADDSASRKFEGVGLGLSISKELITLMGGSINVKSEPDKGSRFWITLPKTSDIK